VKYEIARQMPSTSAPRSTVCSRFRSNDVHSHGGPDSDTSTVQLLTHSKCADNKPASPFEWAEELPTR